MKKCLVLAVIIFFSCHKDELSPTITVTSPINNQIFNGGQTVLITANISDEDGLHMIHLAVTDNTTGGHLVHFEEHFDGRNYTLNQSFSPQSGRSYLIEIEATDHAENTAKQNLTVSAN